MATLSDIPREHRVQLAGRAEHQASQLRLLASVLEAANPDMLISVAYDTLCSVQRHLDSLAVDVARYDPTARR